MDANSLKMTPIQADLFTLVRLANMQEIIGIGSLTIKQVAEDVGISIDMCHKILTEN